MSASTGRRFASGLIDGAVFVVVVAAGTLLFADLSEPFATLPSVAAAASLLQILPEILFARTVGKLVTGMRVVGVDGGKPLTRQLINRAVYKNRVLINAYSLLRGPRARHDRLSGTFVVGSGSR